MRKFPVTPLNLGDEEATNYIDSLAAEIVGAHQYGRHPLFIIGAGISNAAGIPLISDLLKYLHSRADKMQKGGRIRDLCEQSQKTRNRSDIAMLFSELQEALPNTEERELWTGFCSDFLSGRIESSGNFQEGGSILSRSPTVAHNWIAEMCVNYSARCLSLNFDGLTKKAIDKRFKELGDKRRCVILDNAQKIESFFGRDPKNPGSLDLFSIFKLRGDIFYAICRTSGCPMEGKETPVYGLSLLPKNDEQDGGKLLACPECGNPRNLQIAFPGYHIKEQESEKMLDELWRYVVPNTSLIFVVGFSGEWDQSTVEFIFKIGQSQEIPIVDIRRKSSPDTVHYIRDIWRTTFSSVNYGAFYGTADAFAKMIEGALSKHSIESWTGKLVNIGRVNSIPRDDIWSLKDVDKGDGCASICHISDFLQLRYYSQLGLKTFWWGTVEEFADHNRYLHSIGAMRVAERWYGSLLGNAHRKVTNYEQEGELLRIAMLLHDYGHLPFSHLFEEIFNDLHWMPSDNPARPWHEVLTRKKIETLSKGSLTGQSVSFEDYLKQIGYNLKQLIALIDGHTGKGYLDAILNSPIDADKIDYIFRDLHFLKFGSFLPLDPKSWLDEFLDDQDLSPEGIIRLNGRSALRMFELLETRRKLYLDFYIAPELRMMERITAFALICWLSHYISAGLGQRIKITTVPIRVDHSELKVELASKRVLDKYTDIMTNQGAQLREGPLLEYLLAETIDEADTMDPIVIDSLKSLKDLLDQFPKDKDDKPFGKRVRELYRKLHVAGPYYADESHENALREITRELTLMYQGAVLFDVVKTPKFLSGASSREYSNLWKRRRGLVGETFLVPSKNPSEWTVKSRARVPLQTVDFGQLARRYLQVLIFDPRGESSKSRHIHQQFRRKCDLMRILLAESPIIVYGRKNGSS